MSIITVLGYDGTLRTPAEHAEYRRALDTSVDVPFEPQFGDMSREQLLLIARRYHWMLAEVEALSPDSETSAAGYRLEVDQVDREEDQTYCLMYATVTDADGDNMRPYIIGEVQ